MPGMWHPRPPHLASRISANKKVSRAESPGAQDYSACPHLGSVTRLPAEKEGSNSLARRDKISVAQSKSMAWPAAVALELHRQVRRVAPHAGDEIGDVDDDDGKCQRRRTKSESESLPFVGDVFSVRRFRMAWRGLAQLLRMVQGPRCTYYWTVK